MNELDNAKKILECAEQTTGVLKAMYKDTPYAMRKEFEREDIRVAKEFLIKKISEREDIPIEARVAYICNATKIVREYQNQMDIIKKSIKYMNEDNFIDSIDGEWISNFLDKIKNIEDDFAKEIWARILAEEANQNGKITLRGILTLSTLSKDEAKMFMQLKKFVAYFIDTEGVKEPAVIYERQYKDELVKMGFDKISFESLVDAGLIENNAAFGYGIDDYTEDSIKNGVHMFYNNKEFKITSSKRNTIDIGDVNFTKTGRILLSVIGNIEGDSKYEQFLMKYYNEDRDYNIEEVL
ncbi:hypothetical protein lbkm_2622 [Lachnospiraceae bacterium KM106-2]|nr:hypothetical protein lbkm_2622 [Lachnospiraceae bacterium KM106-2]